MTAHWKDTLDEERPIRSEHTYSVFLEALQEFDRVAEMITVGQTAAKLYIELRRTNMMIPQTAKYNSKSPHA